MYPRLARRSRLRFRTWRGSPMKGSPPGRADVAEDAGHGVAPGTPGQQREGGRVGKGPHVAFRVGAVALDGRAVEPDAQFQGILQVIHRDGEPLEVAQDVGEPQADELDVEVAGAAEHVLALGGVVVSEHERSPDALVSKPGRNVAVQGGKELFIGNTGPANHTVYRALGYGSPVPGNMRRQSKSAVLQPVMRRPSAADGPEPHTDKGGQHFRCVQVTEIRRHQTAGS